MPFTARISLRWIFPAAAVLLSQLSRGQTHQTSSLRALTADEIDILSNYEMFSQVILNPVNEAVARARKAADSDDVQPSWSWAVVSPAEGLVYAYMDPVYVESFVTFDLSYSPHDVGEHLSSATLKLYSLNGHLNETIFDIVLDEIGDDYVGGDAEWNVDSDAVGVECIGADPCWVEIDLTEGLSWRTQQQGEPTVTVRMSVDDELVQGAFASSNYRGGRFAPRLVLEFDQDQGLVVADFARKGGLKGTGIKGPRKEKKKGKNKPGNRPGKKKPGKKPGKNQLLQNSSPNKKPNKNKPGKTQMVGSGDNRPGRDKPDKEVLVFGRPGPSTFSLADLWNEPKEVTTITVHEKTHDEKPNDTKPSSFISDNEPSVDQEQITPPTESSVDELIVPPTEPTVDQEQAVPPTESNNSSEEDSTEEDSPSNTNTNYSGTSAAKEVQDILSTKQEAIDNELFLYESPEGGWIPSTIYKYDGLAKGLEIMNGKGVNGMYFYLGGDGKDDYKYGLTNVAAFLAQSMKETIKYDACDENSWDLVNGQYPLSNACGQLGQSYQDYHCPEHEEHMECEVDPDMEITAVTHAKWYGAPAPLFCGPKTTYPSTGYWNYGFECNNAWADPPSTCDVYEGQKAGAFINDVEVANNSGRTDVEGCCWWGRGVIQTTGVCNFGKLNYYLGARAAKEGRDAPYPKLDFCKDPEVICASEENKELKWIAGMFYWMESVQKYESEGWNYIDELHAYVDGGFSDSSFINAVSGIVNRGCHNPPCGTGAVDGGPERLDNFQKSLGIFGLVDDAQPAAFLASGGGGGGSLTLVCGKDWTEAAKCTDVKECSTALDCGDGEYCWGGVTC